jgi:hypothetical protein
MNEHLWAAGVNLKLEHAQFFYLKMSRVLQTDRSATAFQTGAIVGNRWQPSFYAYLDAFLVMTRSIPAIIEYSFGHDRFMKGFASLDADEKRRREQFQMEFAPLHNKFRDHLLAKQTPVERTASR